MSKSHKHHVPAITQGYCIDIYPVRWHPYKPLHTKRTGEKGRWQRMNEYGGWENCEPPSEVFETHDDIFAHLGQTP